MPSAGPPGRAPRPRPRFPGQASGRARKRSRTQPQRCPETKSSLQERLHGVSWRVHDPRQPPARSSAARGDRRLDSARVAAWNSILPRATRSSRPKGRKVPVGDRVQARQPMSLRAIWRRTTRPQLDDEWMNDCGCMTRRSGPAASEGKCASTPRGPLSSSSRRSRSSAHLLRVAAPHRRCLPERARSARALGPPDPFRRTARPLLDGPCTGVPGGIAMCSVAARRSAPRFFATELSPPRRERPLFSRATRLPATTAGVPERARHRPESPQRRRRPLRQRRAFFSPGGWLLTPGRETVAGGSSGFATQSPRARRTSPARRAPLGDRSSDGPAASAATKALRETPPRRRAPPADAPCSRGTEVSSAIRYTPTRPLVGASPCASPAERGRASTGKTCRAKPPCPGGNVTEFLHPAPRL